MVRSKNSKDVFFPIISYMISFVFFAALAPQGFAGEHKQVHIDGEVTSYEEGIYRVQTDQTVVSIRNSKLTASLRQELNSNIGQRISIDIPSTSIISHQQPINREPASVNDRVGVGR